MTIAVQKIKCHAVSDRCDLAAILVNNGYRVWVGREPTGPGKRTLEYYVYFDKKEDDDKEDEA